MRKALIAGAVGLVGFLLVFSGAPAARAFCGSLCNPQAAALAASLQPGAAGATTLGASAVAATEVGAVGMSAGNAWGVAVSGGVAVLASAGVTVMAGGLPDWEWERGVGTVLPAAPGTLTDGAFVTTALSWPGFTNARVEVLSGTRGANDNLSYRMAWNAAPAVAKTFGFEYSCVATPSTWHVGGSNTMNGTQNNGATTFTANTRTSTGSNNCVAAGGWGALRVWQTAPGTGATTTIGTYSVPVSTDAYPGRTIEQTIQCQKPDGTTYTTTNSTTASMALAAADRVAIAGLSCDPGDFLLRAGAVMVSPGRSDTTLVDLAAEPDFVPKWQAVPTPTKVTALTPGTTTTWVSDPDDPVPFVTTVPDPDTSPGTDVEGGTSFCGMTFGDLLTGMVVFKAVGCALSWAFVPSPEVVTATTASLRGTMQATGLESWVGSLQTVGSAVIDLGGSTGGCAGPHFTIPLGGEEYDFDPLDACDPPMSTVAVVIKLLIAVAVVVAAVRLLMRPVLSSFGMGGAV